MDPAFGQQGGVGGGGVRGFEKCYTDTASVTVTAEPQTDGRLLGLALGVDSPRAKPHCPQAWALARAEQPTQGSDSGPGLLVGKHERTLYELL